MGVTIQDDFWEAAQALPEKQRAPFLYAVAAYGFDGSEPEGSPPWLPVFIVIRKRIELSNERSERGRAMAMARWGRGDGSGGGGDDAGGMPVDEGDDMREHMHKHMHRHMHGHDADASGDGVRRHDAESESESEGITPKPPYAEIVGHLNERTGASYRSDSKRTRRLIRARFAEGYTAGDFRAVVDRMADEWGDDPKMSAYLRPETLFGAKFEGYLNRPSPRSPSPPPRRLFDPEEERRKFEAQKAAYEAAMKGGGA